MVFVRGSGAPHQLGARQYRWIAQHRLYGTLERRFEAKYACQLIVGADAIKRTIRTVGRTETHRRGVLDAL
jgi:hypothetical protein